MAKLPKGVVLRKTTRVDLTGKVADITYTQTKGKPKMARAINKADNDVLQASKQIFESMQEQVKKMESINQSGSYKQGRVDGLSFCKQQFDNCKTITDVYAAIDTIRKELAAAS